MVMPKELTPNEILIKNSQIMGIDKIKKWKPIVIQFSSLTISFAL